MSVHLTDGFGHMTEYVGNILRLPRPRCQRPPGRRDLCGTWDSDQGDRVRSLIEVWAPGTKWRLVAQASFLAGRFLYQVK
jgi:hypothetical protein